MVVLVLPEEQALLPHLVMTRSVAVVSWYEITGRPSLPMVIEDSRPWLLAEVMVVEVLPAVQAVLPHLVMTRSKVVASWCEITGRPSVPMVIEENSPWLLAEVMVVEVLPAEQALLPHLVMTRSMVVASWYEITGRPSVPMAIEEWEPWSLAEVMVAVVLPAEQALLPHLVMTRSPTLTS